MAHVLIGFAEALPAPEVVFSLRQAGHKVSAFTRNKNLPLAHLPLEALHEIPKPEDDAKAAQDALRDIINGPDAPDLVLPLDDGGLWLVSSTPEAQNISAGAGLSQAEVALDKSLQIDAAIKAKLPVPQTLVIRNPDDLDQPLPLPAIAKPALATRTRDNRLGKGDATYLSDQASVDAFRESLDATMEPFLIQPLVGGTGQGVFGFVDAQGNVSGWSGHKRVRMMNPHGSGSSACTTHMLDAATKDQITAFMAQINWRGPFMIELLEDAQGTPWFMELNGRMWGSLALARRQGLEYPAWAVSQSLDAEFIPALPPQTNDALVQRNLGREILHLLFVLKGPKSAFHRKTWPSFWRSFAGVFKPAHPRNFYNYDPDHRWFFLRDAWWTIRKVLRR